jgi:hypothetical protein
MAARGLFINLPLETVQAIQARAAALLLEGKTIMAASGEGNSSSKQFPMPIDQVLEECNYAISFRSAGGRVVRRVRGDFSRRGADTSYR